jgi:hypothetical protein
MLLLVVVWVADRACVGGSRGPWGREGAPAWHEEIQDYNKDRVTFIVTFVGLARTIYTVYIWCFRQ